MFLKFRYIFSVVFTVTLFHLYQCSMKDTYGYYEHMIIASNTTGNWLTVLAKRPNTEIRAISRDRVTNQETKWNVLGGGNGHSYHIMLKSDQSYTWYLKNGCGKRNAPIVISPEPTRTKITINYNFDTKIISLCGNMCAFIEPADSVLRATTDCDGRDDKYFNFIYKK